MRKNTQIFYFMNMNCENYKPKRQRCNPIKKWTWEEEQAIVDFLLKNRNFEKPTAQIYYRRFSAETKIETDWKLIRAKVRNMRITYQKTKDWWESKGANGLQSDLLRRCKYFYGFEEMFDGGGSVGPPVNDLKVESVDFSERPFFNPPSADSAEEFVPATSTDSNASSSKGSPNGSTSWPEITDVLGLQSELIVLKKRKKQEQDQSFREENLRLRESLLQLKEKELEIKLREIESQERIKMREIEMKEKIAMEELRLKYK